MQHLQGRAEGGFQGFQETPLEFHQLVLRNYFLINKLQFMIQYTN